MMSLTKNPKAKTQKIFSLQTTRLAKPFEHLNSSLELMVPELCLHKAVKSMICPYWASL